MSHGRDPYRLHARRERHSRSLYEKHAHLRAHVPVYRVPGRDDFFVSRYEDVVYVTKDPEVFYCIGAPLAQLGMAVAFQRLLARLADIRFAGPDARLDYPPNPMFRALAKLDLTFTPVANPEAYAQ